MIFVSGENLIDLIADKKDIYKPFVGGSSLNTALALGRLKSKVFFYSRISNDYFGKMIFDHLKKSNVNVSLIERTNDQSTIAIVVNKKKPEFSIHFMNTASINFKSFKINKNYLNKIKFSHFSSISLALSPSAETHIKLMHHLKRNTKSIISIDPNVRPSVIKNKKNYLQNFKKFMKYADIIKMSNEDFSYISKNKLDSQVRYWLNKYSIKIFIITLGDKGSILYTNKYKIFQKTEKIKVIDTVGAGDSFIAGVIAYLDMNKIQSNNQITNISKENLINCLYFATKVAEKNCLEEGNNPPYLKKVQQFINSHT